MLLIPVKNVKKVRKMLWTLKENTILYSEFIITYFYISGLY